MAPTFATDDAKWDAVRARDAAADGVFLYAVATTGVYCRPSCAARPARRENMAFYPTRPAAERQGFRACRRCRPDLPPRAERDAVMVPAACRKIEEAEEPPSLDQLAAAAGVSPYHFHRLFGRVAGVTPRAYADAHRAARVRDGLRAVATVTSAYFDAGFNSSGRFYAAAGGVLGMTPSAYRAGGVGERICYAAADCALGTVLVGVSERGVCAILIDDDAAALRADLAHRFPRANLVADDGFSETVAATVATVDGTAADLPLDIRGTAFQRRVWEVLRTIPAGATLSYAAVAERIGSPNAVRAVAGACGANKLAVAVPCHRVVGSDGGLGGYRWGVERKRALLARERP